MNSKERFWATLKREPTDRPASWLGMPEKHALPALLAYFQVDTLLELKQKIGDDIWPVDVPYLCELFPTGLILSPSHEAILADIPPSNIEVLFEAIRE